jgi:Rad3-related DNA helicase
MNEQAREAFLQQFEEIHENGLAGFCVMGGIFGEGIDLKNDRLIGAIIVGTGIPQICNERELLKQFYDKRGEDGFFYAYLCPGMNKVLQSAGRVIRTEEDRGVVLLLDERFASARYRRMFPAEWESPGCCTLSTVSPKLEAFWEVSV